MFKITKKKPVKIAINSILVISNNLKREIKALVK
jgi:hypothetical protein